MAVIRNMESPSFAYKTQSQPTPGVLWLIVRLTFALRVICFQPGFLFVQRFAWDAILTARPGAQVDKLTALGAKRVRRRVRPRDLACTVWTLATKRPSHAFLPSDMFSPHSQYDKQARTRQARESRTGLTSAVRWPRLDSIPQ